MADYPIDRCIRPQRECLCDGFALEGRRRLPWQLGVAGYWFQGVKKCGSCAGRESQHRKPILGLPGGQHSSAAGILHPDYRGCLRSDGFHGICIRLFFPRLPNTKQSLCSGSITAIVFSSHWTGEPSTLECAFVIDVASPFCSRALRTCR